MAERLIDRFGEVWVRLEDEADEWETESGAGLYWTRAGIEEHCGPTRPAPDEADEIGA